MTEAYFIIGVNEPFISVSEKVSEYFNNQYLVEVETQLKNNYPNLNWNQIRLGERYKIEYDDSPYIALSQRVEHLKKVIEEKYPKAKVIVVSELKQQYRMPTSRIVTD